MIKLESGQQFTGRHLVNETLYSVGGHFAGQRIEDIIFDGCDPSIYDGAQPMYFDGGSRIKIKDVSCFNVPRALLCYPGGWHGKDMTDIQIDGLTVAHWAPPPGDDQNKAEALLFHGNAARPGQAIRDLRTSNVHIYDWSGSPFTIWEISVENCLLTEWVSTAAGPIGIGLRPCDRVDNLKIRGGHWERKEIRWFIFGHLGPYTADVIGKVETPAGWVHTLTLFRGGLEYHEGPFDSIGDVRKKIVEISQGFN